MVFDLKYNWVKWGAPILLILITVVTFLPSMENGWVEWDDQKYILNNPLVGEFSWELIVENFTSFTLGAYHPLTTLSYCIDYEMSGYSPATYHTTNLIIHIINALLVFAFVLKLKDNLLIAFTASLLFSIHPMHVESVAWVAGRKDMLMALFFLLGLIAYLESFKSERKIMWLVITLFCFILSLLSKGTAIVFPIVLLLLDYFKNGVGRKEIFNKIHYVVIAIVFAVIAKNGQQSVKAMESIESVNYFQTMFVGAYTYCMYLIKSIVPFDLSAFHPYPYDEGENLLWYIWGSMLPIIIGGLCFYKWGRRNKDLILGLGFFTITIFLMLQILPFGASIIAERFTYLPYVGLFILVAVFINDIVVARPKLKNMVLAVFTVYSVVLGVQSYGQSKVWKDDFTLWSKVMKVYPKEAEAVCNRSLYLMRIKEYDLAIADCEKCAELTEFKFDPVANIGVIYVYKGQDSLALEYFNKSIELNNNYVLAYLNRGMLHLKYKRYEKAFYDFKKVRGLDKNNSNAIYGEGVILLNNNQLERASLKLDSALYYGCNLEDLKYHRGLSKLKLNQYQLGIEAFNLDLSTYPEKAKSYYMRSQCFWKLGNMKAAKYDVEQSIKYGWIPDKEYLKILEY